MPLKKEKKHFDWKTGEVLSEEHYEPVPQVRAVGFNKLAQGLHADPILRKKNRKKKLEQPSPIVAPNLLIEESESGLHADVTPSEASRLIHKSKMALKGLGRFKKP